MTELNTRERDDDDCLHNNNNKSIHLDILRNFINRYIIECVILHKPEESLRTPNEKKSTENAQKGANTLFLYKLNRNRTCNSCYYANSRVSDSRGRPEGSTQEYLLDSGATTHVMTTAINAIAMKNTTGYGCPRRERREMY